MNIKYTLYLKSKQLQQHPLVHHCVFASVESRIWKFIGDEDFPVLEHPQRMKKQLLCPLFVLNFCILGDLESDVLLLMEQNLTPPDVYDPLP